MMVAFSNSAGYFRTREQAPRSLAEFPKESSPTSSLRSTFNPAAGMAVAPTAQLVLTDIMPNTKFEVPVIAAASRINVDRAVNFTPAETSSLREDVSKTAEAYLEANRQAMGMIADAIMKAEPENGPGVIGAIFPAVQNSSSMSAGAAALDPTGIAGNVYAVLNEVSKAARTPDNAVVNEVLTKALHSLHSASEKTLGTVRADAPQFDFSPIQTPVQLRKFIQRNPETDPVMQQVKEVNRALDTMDLDTQNLEYHYGDKVTEDKVTQAVSSGDNEFVRAAATDESQAELLHKGVTQREIEFIAPEILEASATLPELKGVRVAQADLASLDAIARDTAQALDREASLHRFARPAPSAFISAPNPN